MDESALESNRRELYSTFYDSSKDFKKHPRAFCFDIAKGLIYVARKENPDDWPSSEKTTRAILLLLFCWNYASPVINDIKHKDILNIITETKEEIKELDDKTLLDFNKQDENLISRMYTIFKQKLGQTATSSVLSLINPDLFLMWNTQIRKRLRGYVIEGIDDGTEAEHYLNYLRGIRKIFKKYNLPERIEDKDEIARKINEYHYVKIIMVGE